MILSAKKAPATICIFTLVFAANFMHAMQYTNECNDIRVTFRAYTHKLSHPCASSRYNTSSAEQKPVTPRISPRYKLGKDALASFFQLDKEHIKKSPKINRPVTKSYSQVEQAPLANSDEEQAYLADSEDNTFTLAKAELAPQAANSNWIYALIGWVAHALS